MPTPILLQLYKKPWQVIDRVLGAPRAMGAAHTFHEYARPGGGYYIVFEKGIAAQITVTLRQPASSAEKALALVGMNSAGRSPIRKSRFESVWHGLLGLAELRVRSSNGRYFDVIEVRAFPMAG